MKLSVNKKILLLAILIIVVLTFMASGYSILRNRFNLFGTSSINNEIAENPDKDDEDMSKICKSKLEFTQKSQWAGTFVYDVTIHNYSDQTYEEWQLKLYDTGYVSIPPWFEADEQDDGWLVTSEYRWDSSIEPGGSLTVTIMFNVLQEYVDSMTSEEYADYFVNNYIIVYGCGIAHVEYSNIAITNGNSSLNLGEFEEEVKTYTLKKNEDYVGSSNPNEKQYILTINNTSSSNYTGIRANIYYGKENTLASVSPSEVVYKYDTNATLETPNWITVPANETLSIYINIITEDETFIPDIVVSALINQE